jgi:hypothetical protein
MKRQNDLKKQIALFDAIRSNETKQNLAETVSQLLEMSIDPAYKRISGKVPLTFTELRIIRDHFGISIDRVLDGCPESGIKIYNAPIDISDTEGYNEFLKQLIGRMRELNTSSMEFMYTAHGIPIHHACPYPELVFFRLFACKDTLHQPGVSYTAFCNSLDREKILSLYQQLYDHSIQIPSTEIWCSQTVDQILSRIKYFYEVGAFGHSDTPLFILSQVQLLLNTVHQYAKSGFKDAKKRIPFRMYVCSVDPDYDILLAMKDAQPYYSITQILNSRFGTFEQTLCNNTWKWVNDLKTKSVHISGISSFKEMEQFFQSSKAKIERMTDEITTK